MSIPYVTLINERLTGQSISNEPHIIGIVNTSTYEPGFVRLVEVPQAPAPLSSVSIPGYTEIMSGTPTGTQFLVNYTTGIITFDTSNDGNSILVSYVGLGSEFAAEDVNEVQNPLGTIATQTIVYNWPAAPTVSWSLANNIVSNANVSPSAAIGYSKLNLVGDIVNADINASAAIAYSKLNLTGDIVNADISSSASISYSKLAPLGGSTNDVLIQSGGGFVTPSSILSTNLFLADGSVNATGAFNLNSHQIHNVTDPTSAQDAATKNYVDGHTTTPGGSNGAVQFNNSSVFGGDATNLFWDNSTKRLGIDTNTPASALDVGGGTITAGSLTTSGTIQSNGDLRINGALELLYTTQTTSLSLSSSATSVQLVDASGGPVTITLPSLGVFNRGTYTFVKIDSSANAVIITAFGTDTIDGLASYTLNTQYAPLTIISSNTAWYIKSSFLAASGSTGSVQFNSNGILQSDSSNFFWDSTTHRLGIGISSPLAPLDVQGVGGIATRSVSDHVYNEILDFTNYLILTPTGSPAIQFSSTIRKLFAPLGAHAATVDYGNRLLLDSAGTSILDWSTAAVVAISGQVGINQTTPAASAALDIVSTTKGFLPPRMTTTQRDAISSPATGLVVYNTTDNQWEGWNGSSWSILG